MQEQRIVDRPGNAAAGSRDRRNGDCQAGARVVVVGQGNVGLLLATEAVEAGHDVVGLGVDSALARCLNSGRSHVDDVSDDRLAAAVLGYAFRMVETAEEINRAAPFYVVQRCCLLLNDSGLAARGARVLLLGVTYKPGIADCRESPASVVARQLASLGCEVSYHHPYVPVWEPGSAVEFDCVPDLQAAISDADVVVLLQVHPEYKFDEIAAGAKRLLDTRGVVDTAAPSVTRL